MGKHYYIACVATLLYDGLCFTSGGDYPHLFRNKPDNLTFPYNGCDSLPSNVRYVEFPSTNPPFNTTEPQNLKAAGKARVVYRSDNQEFCGEFLIWYLGIYVITYYGDRVYATSQNQHYSL